MNVFTVNAFGGYGNQFVHDNMTFFIILMVAIFLATTILSLRFIKDETLKVLLPSFLSIFLFLGIVGVTLNEKNFNVNENAIIQKIESNYNITYKDNPKSVTNYQLGFKAVDNRNNIPLKCHIKPITTKDYHKYKGAIKCNYTVEVKFD